MSPDCSPPSEPSELFPPPVEEAPLADEVSDADDAEAADADEADAEEADIDDATESAYVVSKAKMSRSSGMRKFWGRRTDGAENGLCSLRPVEAVACGSDHPVERVGRVAPIPILASIAPPAIVDLRADDSWRAILGVGFVRKVEYLLKCVALKEVYVDQVALCVLRQPRIPWEMIRCGGDTPLVQHVQTKDAYWC